MNLFKASSFMNFSWGGTASGAASRTTSKSKSLAGPFGLHLQASAPIQMYFLAAS
jgi:hypothetical protein